MPSILARVCIAALGVTLPSGMPIGIGASTEGGLFCGSVVTFASDCSVGGSTEGGSCGGFAPLTSECSFETVGCCWFMLHSFYFPPCGSSYATLPMIGEGEVCYVGTLKSTATSSGTYVHTVTCDVVATPARKTADCQETGGVEHFQVVSVQCWSTFTFLLPELQPPPAGGFGEWQCYFF